MYALATDEYATIKLSHNGQYVDTINAYYDGLWTKDGNTFTLQPTGETGTCQLVLSEDLKTAEYKDLEGTSYSLILFVEPMLTFEGTTFKLEMYADNTCAIRKDSVNVVTGEFSTPAEGEYKITLDGVEVPVTKNADGSSSIEYTVDGVTETLTSPVPAAE